MGSFRVELVQTRLGNPLAVLRIVLQVDPLCQCLERATDYFPERINATIEIFNCKGQGTYQCGWGDCSTNFSDQNPFNIILRDDQKSAATSLRSKSSNTLAVGLGVGLSLGLCWLVSLYLLHRQRCRLNLAASTSSRNSVEKPWGGWQWAQGHGSSMIPELHSPLPPQSAHIPPVRYEASPTTVSADRGPPLPPKIPKQRCLQELRDESNESHELACHSRDSNGTREFV